MKTPSHKINNRLFQLIIIFHCLSFPAAFSQGNTTGDNNPISIIPDKIEFPAIWQSMERIQQSVKAQSIMSMRSREVNSHSHLLYDNKSSGRQILSVPGSYPSIQSAINAAGIGDTVLVSTGTYNENINFYGKPIMVASQYLITGDSSDITQTIIDGGDLGPVAQFITNESANSFLVGFTLRNGTASAGGGILCINSHPVLSNLVIKNCNADYGGGIYLYESDAYIWRVALFNNSATYYGGAISCDTYAYPAIYNVVMDNNDAAYGGGLHCYLSDPYLAYFEITDNSADYGAGIYLYTSSPYMWEGRISDNSSVNYGGGMECDYYSYPYLYGLLIDENTSLYGAGIHLGYSNPEIINSTITGNEADFGGGIYGYFADPVIKNSIISYNQGLYGYYSFAGTPDISFSDFWANETANFYNCGKDVGLNFRVNINNDSCDLFNNIQISPQFVNVNFGNYHLGAGSPCIDAGDPDSPQDPDGSVTDMGKYYYPQTFVANFSAEPVWGLPPLMVQFYDESSGNPTQWQWDFNNDGIIDSNTQNPQWEYDEMGYHTVKLKILSTLHSDTRIKTNFIRIDFTEKPSITQILDIPNDQGGWVEVHFLRSVYDTDSLVQRTPESYSVQYNIGSGWVTGNTTVAYGADVYAILCHTPFDSTSTNLGIIDFRIIAAMEEGNFASGIASGYSVDNLSPQIPQGLEISYTGENFHLVWQPVGDPDLMYYAIYQIGLGGVIPEEPLAYSTVPYLEDLPVGFSPETLAVRSVDFSGNKSLLSDPVDAPMQMVMLFTKGWNALSGYVVPVDPQLPVMFEPIQNQIDILTNQTGYWYPSLNQNTIGEWRSDEGYFLKSNSNEYFAITGFIEKNKTVELSQGWNLIPVLANCQLSVADIAATLEPNLKFIQEGATAKIFWPEKNIANFGYLVPGKSYRFYMYAPGQLIFPECN
nr:hypothetical protein [Bacteroidota bacterium]